MHIGMILDNEFTGDVRVENEVMSLQKAGHKVFVLCLNYGNKRSFEDFSGAKIIRVFIPLLIKNKLKGLNNTIINLYPRFWSRHIKKFIIENNIEVLHVHDLWMLESAYIANKSFKLPVVADLHENFVQALYGYKYANTFPGNILISKKRWQKKEVEWTKKADKIITVIEEAVERYQKLGNEIDKIVVLPNYVNLDSFLTSSIDKNILEKFSENFTLTYVGGFDSHRGLESAIRAVSNIIKVIRNFKLVLVGSGSNFNDLKKLANELDVSEYISFEGWQPHEKLISYIKASDMCLIPHLKTVHTDNTIPHKLFQYMILEKPVVSSNLRPIERILSDTEAGVIFKSNDESDLAEKVISLYKNPKLMKTMGENGKRGVIEKYNWDKAAEKLINLYKNI